MHTNTYTVTYNCIVTLHSSLLEIQTEFIFVWMNTYDIAFAGRRDRQANYNLRVHRAVNNFRFLEAFVYYIMLAAFLLAVLQL